MLKRILAIIVITYLFPAMAHAASWSLSTWARTSGGAIQVGSGTPRTSLQGMLITTYATETPVTVTVIPNPGYTVSKILFNGTSMLNPTQTVFTVNGPTAQNVHAYFSLQKFSITTTVAGNIGGTVSPATIANLTPGVLASARVITFIPATTSFTVSNISGIPSGAIQSPTVPGAGQAVSVTFPAGFNVTANYALVGTFTSQNPVANAGTRQTVYTGTTVTLNGSGSLAMDTGISSYSWSQLSGPAVTLTDADAALARFIPTAVGTYQFSLTLMPGGSTALVMITVYESISGLVRDRCYNCHSAAGVGIVSNVFGNWSSSGHKTKGVLCSQCHVGADTGGHPGLIRGGSVSAVTFDYTVVPLSGSSNYCVTCHNPAIVTDFAASKHSLQAGASSCSFCHKTGVHKPDAACTDCHKTDNSYGLAWPPAAFTFHSSFTGNSKLCKACHVTHNPKVLSIKTSCP